MLLNIYLGTVVVSRAVEYMFLRGCVRKFIRDGYKFVEYEFVGEEFLEEEESFSEKVKSFMTLQLDNLIPGYNLAIPMAVFLRGGKMYDWLVEKALDEGVIYKPITKELNNDYKSEGKADTYTASVQKTRTEKTYDEMTTEEKLAYLQQEREKLINQATPQVENSFTLGKRRK